VLRDRAQPLALVLTISVPCLGDAVLRTARPCTDTGFSAPRGGRRMCGARHHRGRTCPWPVSGPTSTQHSLNILSTSTQHPLNVDSTLTQHSLSIHSTSTQYPLNIHSTFTQHSLNILSTFMRQSLNIYLTSSQHSPNIHSFMIWIVWIVYIV
jgi:hypothetical protein